VGAWTRARDGGATMSRRCLHAGGLAWVCRPSKRPDNKETKGH
jgi:hypothetical protein